MREEAVDLTVVLYCLLFFVRLIVSRPVEQFDVTRSLSERLLFLYSQERSREDGDPSRAHQARHGTWTSTSVIAIRTAIARWCACLESLLIDHYKVIILRYARGIVSPAAFIPFCGGVAGTVCHEDFSVAARDLGVTSRTTAATLTGFTLCPGTW